MLWCHPAFANRRAYVHNGQELLCVSLAETNATTAVDLSARLSAQRQSFFRVKDTTP